MLVCAVVNWKYAVVIGNLCSYNYIFLCSFPSVEYLQKFAAVAPMQNAIRRAQKIILSIKISSASGGFAPWPTDQELCPWTPLGAPPIDPRYRLNSSLCSTKFFLKYALYHIIHRHRNLLVTNHYISNKNRCHVSDVTGQLAETSNLK